MTEMTERLERALEELEDHWEPYAARNTIVLNVKDAYREARDAPSEEQGHTIEFQNAEGHTVSVPVEQCFAGADKVEIGDWPDKQGRYPQSGVGVPAGYVLRQFPDGLFWVPSEPTWETPLTVERLVRVLREVASEHKHLAKESITIDGMGGLIAGWLAEALEAKEE